MSLSLAEVDRRSLIRGLGGLGGALALARVFPAWAQSGSAGLAPAPGVLSGEQIALTVGESHFSTGGRSAHAVMINGTLPAPLIRLKEGQNVRLSVTNNLKEDTSIHWHGLIVPFQMDGVPGVSFPGIRPGETFSYEFPIRQSGTYWYHSHSGMQEAVGHYGPIVIDPAGADPVQSHREHVIVLSDWSPVHPHVLLKRLKQSGGYFNMQRQTLAGLIAGKDQSAKERREWGAMRMDPTDISDVTGSTYSFLVNGHGTAENWTGLFTPGERVRLRIINASAMTNFNVRLPGLPMTVVQCDGQHVQPVAMRQQQRLFPVRQQQRMLRDVPQAPGNDDQVQREIEEDQDDGDANGLAKAFQEDGAERGQQHQRHRDRVLGPLRQKGILDEVCGRVRGGQRDGDDEAGGRETKQAEDERLTTPPREELLEDGDAALAVRAQLRDTAIHRQGPEQGEEHEDDGGDG